MFKNRAKNLPKDNPKVLVNSPNRKSTFQNCGLDSPSKKNKFKISSTQNDLAVGTWSRDTNSEYLKSESDSTSTDQFGD